jgi:mono/diheme cytochrome c family protein
MMHLVDRPSAAVLVGLALGGALGGAAQAPETETIGSHAAGRMTGAEIYRAACTGCHGPDGSGTPRTTVGFATPLPDFSDCNFATRENDADWTAIIRDGGPVRGFTRFMPAFRDALTAEEIRGVIHYLRGFCRSSAWPLGGFNLPRALMTEKAFPEDEAVLTTTVNTSGPGSVSSELVYERRFGPRDQLEVDVPFAFAQRAAGGSWTWSLGDIALGPKHTFVHSLASGTILSGLGQIALPTGDTAKGTGAGTTAFELSALLGQLLPARSYFQLQGGVVLMADRARAPHQAFWRGALGTTVPFGSISRIWSPMVEVVGTRDLVSGASAAWDVVPQFQLSLSARQHVRANVGVSVPLTETDSRHPQLLAYLLWDWFDGGFLEGWKGWCPGCQH